MNFPLKGKQWQCFSLLERSKGSDLNLPSSLHYLAKMVMFLASFMINMMLEASKLIYLHQICSRSGHHSQVRAKKEDFAPIREQRKLHLQLSQFEIIDHSLHFLPKLGHLMMIRGDSSDFKRFEEGFRS